MVVIEMQVILASHLGKEDAVLLHVLTYADLIAGEKTSQCFAQYYSETSICITLWFLSGCSLLFPWSSVK